jgi:hypothetical protein
MLKRFSKDIVQGDVRHLGEMATREDTKGIFAVPQWRGRCSSKTSGQMSSRAPFQSHIEDVLMDIFFSLPSPTGTANSPKNVSKKEFSTKLIFFYRREGLIECPAYKMGTSHE